MTYDLDYFITKFSAIPEDKWTTGKYTDGDCYCAYGHCGLSDDANRNSESDALFSISMVIPDVNDGLGYTAFGTTPKQRVVNYLKSLKTQ